ncbi:MAG: hypothetical protein ABI539_14015 [Acidobacteriota bacterium]
MRALTLSVVLFLGVGLLSAANANGQSEHRLSATPKAFQLFFAKFKTAALKRDGNAVASLTSFPFEYGWDAGDEGTYNRRQFLAKFRVIFSETDKLFGQRNPIFYVENGSYTLSNDEDASHFSFKKSGATYKFSGFFVEP